MSIKLAILKSGEDVIADIQEMVFEEKVVGYFCKRLSREERMVQEAAQAKLLPVWRSTFGLLKSGVTRRTQRTKAVRS